MDLIANKVAAIHDGGNYDNILFVKSSKGICLIILAYLTFVLKLGPALMKNRQRFELKGVLLAYNATQVILNFSLAFSGLLAVFYYKVVDVGCIVKLPVDHQWKTLEYYSIYIYYLIRIGDFLDTIFFVLRKNYRQVSFLHVYHHILVVAGGHLYLRIHGFGGHSLGIGILNATVHSVMYAYYFFTALNPDFKNNISIKKNITRLQITQFALFFIHNAYPLLFRQDCQFPKIWMVLNLINAVVFLVLFSKFYIKTYILPKKPKNIEAHENGTSENGFSFNSKRMDQIDSKFD